MTTPCTGTIFLSDVNAELGRTPSAPIYMANPAERQLAGVPTGTIWMSDFYCKSSEVRYTWTGTGAGAGVNLNMFNLFGSPTQAAKYIFVNNGEIGGTIGSSQPALVTGIFPAGSTLEFINNGVVSGAGGTGGSIQQSISGSVTHGQPGRPGFRADFPIYINNSNGFIQGGGGGGGATSDLAGSNWYMIQGSGGAGIPGGTLTSYGWVSESGRVGSMFAGGVSGYGTSGGNAGSPAPSFPTVINNDYDKRSMGGGYGPSILGGNLISSNSVGLTPVTPGTRGGYVGQRINSDNNIPYVLIQSITGNINATAGGAVIDLSIFGSGITSVARLSGSAAIVPAAVSNTQYTFKVTGTSGGQSPRTFVSATYRFTVSNSNGSNYYDFTVYVGYTNTSGGGGGGGGSCFTADSTVLMHDNKLKRIDEIVIGDIVKTAFGYSEVTYIQMPLLGDRKILSMLNNKCKTSAEHPIWARNKTTGAEWWSTRDFTQWTIEQDMARDAGCLLEGSAAVDIYDNTGSYQYATVDGWVDAVWEEIQAEPDLQLYHLHLKDGGGYFVDGYLVEDSGHESAGYKYGDQRWRDLQWNGVTK